MQVGVHLGARGFTTCLITNFFGARPGSPDPLQALSNVAQKPFTARGRISWI